MTKVSLTVNGKAVSGDVDPRTLLVHFIRDNLRLTGTHVGCDTSQCGACVVHVDGKVSPSSDIETIHTELILADLQTLEKAVARLEKESRIKKESRPAFENAVAAQKVLDAGGEFHACGTCLKLRNSEGSEVCPLSPLKDHYEIVRDSDRLITV